MSLSFCVLGSGSGGNSTLVMCGRGARRSCLLIDAGLSPRATTHRMAALGVRPDDIRAILLTHLDGDHFYATWMKLIVRHNIRVHVHKRHRNAAWQAGLTARHVELFTDSIELEGSVQAHPVLMAHDELGSVGYVLEHRGFRLGYATDLGRVPKSVIDHFSDLNALAIESNYDHQMQLDSGRPIYLKRRIMGGHGHLSNEQSLEAVHRIAAASPLSHIALLHLSQQCNDPELVRELYEEHAPHLVDRLTITSQHEPSPLLEVRRVRHVRGARPAPSQPQRADQPAAQARARALHADLPLFAEIPAAARPVVA